MYKKAKINQNKKRNKLWLSNATEINFYVNYLSQDKNTETFAGKLKAVYILH